MYLDEVDIHLNPKIGPEWTLAGQKYVRTPGCNEKRYLAGATVAEIAIARHNDACDNTCPWRFVRVDLE